MVSTYPNYVYLNPDDIKKSTSNKLKRYYCHALDEHQPDFSKQSWADFNLATNAKIKRSTFSGFWTGSRFNISFSFLAAQRMNVPLSYLLGDKVYEYEKKCILENNFTALKSINTQKITMGVPKEYGHLSGLHQTELPNDIGEYKKGELCLVEYQQPTKQLKQDSIVLAKQDGSLVAMKLCDIDLEQANYIGGIKYILTRT